MYTVINPKYKIMPNQFIPQTHTSVQSEQTKTLKGAISLFCSGGSPRLLLFQLLVAGCLRVYMGNIQLIDILLVAAVFCYWPLQEWFLHKTVLHAKPKTIMGIQWDTPMGYVHRYHHRNPWILETIFVPTTTIMMLMPIHAGIWYLITPSIEIALTGITAFTLCALFYEWIHFFSHIPYVPKNTWLKKVQRNHRAHHFKNENYWYAFTIPHLDALFGTGPDPKKTPRSNTCKTLGVEDSFPIRESQHK